MVMGTIKFTWLNSALKCFPSRKERKGKRKKEKGRKKKKGRKQVYQAAFPATSEN